MRGGFFLLIVTAAILIITTFVLVRYAQGYRLAFDGNNLFTKEGVKVSSTGLLVATSTPDGASVYINDKLTSATNSTLDLPPGEYTVKIVKEGYLTWEKKVKIQKEIVTTTQALLFPAAPKLESITATGVLGPVVDPSGSSIAYGVASASAIRKNGVFILDMPTRPILTLRNASTQIADDLLDKLSSGQFSFSPNGKELLVGIPKPAAKTPTYYLLSVTDFNIRPDDITLTIQTVLTQWEKEKAEKEDARLATLKTEQTDFIRKNFHNLAWSNDTTKILYEASSSAAIPTLINPPLLGASTQKEEREIKKERYYVYDTKEDKNFFIKEIDSNLPAPIWLPDDRHLVFIEEKQVKIIEYDGTNKTIVYAGPFESNFVYPWPDGSRVVILTSLNPQGGITPNLYTINLK